LIKKEAMMLQPFQQSVPQKGEVSMMIMGGQYTHAVLKKAKAGDFRVQDDFGGTVELYEPSNAEIAFAEKVVAACAVPPLYARVDIIEDNAGDLAVIEMELIEPELWFRLKPEAADVLAAAVVDYV
jgi:glutathione synthase/RimK-type ligase-like ATP-grasp enzyme